MRWRSVTALVFFVLACSAEPQITDHDGGVPDSGGGGGGDGGERDGSTYPDAAADGGDAMLPPPDGRDLTITVTTDHAPPAAIDDIVVVRIRYENIGDTDADTAAITMAIPAGTELHAGGAATAWSCADRARARMSCTANVGPIAEGASGSAEIALRVISTVGTIAARFEITPEFDADLSNNVATFEHRAGDVTTTIMLQQNTVLAAPIGPDRTALYTNEPPNTPPNIARIIVPMDYTGDRELPLIMMLHGLDGSSNAISGAFGHRWATNATTRGYFLILPNGTLGPNNRRHWNATDSCCDREAGNPDRDDVGYLTELLIEATDKYRVDVSQVYVLGFSNGAFMSYRLACEIPEMITAIAPIAGATFQDEMSCASPIPISVLHIHGTADSAVRFYDMDYDHDRNPATPSILDRADTPGARQSLSRFAEKAGCDISSMADRDNINLWHPNPRTDPPDPPYTIGEGDETIVREFEGCDPNFQLTLWEVQDATHALWFEYDVNLISDSLLPHERILSWLLAHRR